MKKAYLTPDVAELDIITESVIAASIPVIDGEVDTEVPGTQLGNDRRGEWGNLWK